MKTVDWRKTLTIALAFAAAAGAQAVWDGTYDISWFEKYPNSRSCTLSTAKQLAGLAYVVKNGVNSAKYSTTSKTFTLTGDITLNERQESEPREWTAIGDFDNPFNGTFNGAGFVIRGVYINKDDNYQGLFGYVNNGAIKNVRVAESNIKGGRYVGGVVGMGDGTTTVSGCSMTGDSVSGGDYVGGLAGYNKRAVTDSYATAAVSGAGDTVGGLIGANGGAVTNSYATGNVSGGSYVGGLTGAGSAAIINCYATGEVSGSGYVGGLAGGQSGAAIKNCYAAGAVPGAGEDGEDGGYGAVYGGLVGELGDGAEIVYSYYNREASDAEGLTGIPKWAEEMRDEGFVGVLNVAAYALSGNRWVNYAPGSRYPTLVSEPVSDADFYACFGGGDGKTGSKPLIIKTVRQLENLAVLVNCDSGSSRGKYFKLGDNIYLNTDTADAGGWGAVPPEYEWRAIGGWKTPFNGSFDGGGFVVGGMYINGTDTSDRYQGLFGRVGKEGVIKNVGVVSSYVNGYCYAGGLAGWNEGRITKCFSGANITASSGDKGGGGVGGLVGVNKGDSITDSYAVGNISGGVNMAGGLVGWNAAGGKVTYCYARGKVDVTGDDVGGLVGRNDTSAVIRNSYAAGEVSGTGDAVGGLVGVNVNAVVSKCYAVGNVAGSSSVGGLVGLKLGSSNKIDSSYYRTEASSSTNGYGTPKTEDEMMLRETYAGWDFNAVWAIDAEIRSYPYINLGSRTNGVLSADRVIPNQTGGGSAAISPAAALTAEFTAGPNPAKRGGGVDFFRRGKRISAGELWVYDASGSVVNKIKIADGASVESTRKVGSWNLTDAKGRNVPDGAYLVKGAVVTAGGKRNKVSITVGVR